MYCTVYSKCKSFSILIGLYWPDSCSARNSEQEGSVREVEIKTKIICHCVEAERKTSLQGKNSPFNWVFGPIKNFFPAASPPTTA